jgi:copper chaperone CopZ
MVSRQTEEARVVYDDAKQAPEKLAQAVDRLGFQASVLSVTAAPRPTLYVEGLRGLAEVRRVEQVLKGISGVREVTVDPKDGEVYVEYDSRAVKPRDLVAALAAAGIKARLASP